MVTKYNQSSKFNTLSLAEVLTGSRQRLGMSIGELAKLSGVSAPYILRIEQGKINYPNGEVLHKLSQKLNVDLFAHVQYYNKKASE